VLGQQPGMDPPGRRADRTGTFRAGGSAAAGNA